MKKKKKKRKCQEIKYCSIGSLYSRYKLLTDRYLKAASIHVKKKHLKDDFCDLFEASGGLVTHVTDVA